MNLLLALQIILTLSGGTVNNEGYFIKCSPNMVSREWERVCYPLADRTSPKSKDMGYLLYRAERIQRDALSPYTYFDKDEAEFKYRVKLVLMKRMKKTRQEINEWFHAEAVNKNILIRMCSDCQRILGVKKETTNHGASHGYCQTCVQKLYRSVNKGFPGIKTPKQIRERWQDTWAEVFVEKFI